MAGDKHHIGSSEDYLRYLKGKMSPKESHEFEKQLLQDDFENEAFDGLAQLKPDELTADFNQLRSELASKTRKRNYMVYWRVAAAILFLAIFSFVTYYFIESNSTREIAQSSEDLPEKEGGLIAKKEIVTEDSMQEQSERIIAYKQEIKEEPKEIQQKPPELPQVDEMTEIVEIEDAEDLLAVDLNTTQEIEMEAAEPAELPTIDREELAGAPLELETEGDENKTMAREAVPPTAMKQSRYAARIRDVRTITGKIVSREDDEAIPGVNVIVKGSNLGTVTDFEGNYSIDVPKDKDVTLVYSYIGFSSEEVEVKDKDNIDVNIEPDVNSLSEIVVTGYGVDKDVGNAPYSYTPPMPKGGNGLFREYIEQNIRYPSAGLDEKIKGTVKLKFSVGIHGEISNMEIVKSLGTDFDREAIRLVTEGPAWEPAIENDSTITKEVKVKIRFRPPE